MKRMAQSLTRRPFFIGVAGGTASGKSSVCNAITSSLTETQKSNVAIVCQDSFYRDLSDAELKLANQGKFNFDHPNAFDHDMIFSVLQQMANNETVEIPFYDYKTNARISGQFDTVPPVDVVLFEGILIFHDPRVRELFNMKIFVDADPDIRLARRVQRDIADRGRSLDHVLKHYEAFVKPAFDDFCLPSKKYADIIIPRGSANTVAIDLIVKHIKDWLLQSPRSTPVSTSNSCNGLQAINVAAHTNDNGQLPLQNDQENQRPPSSTDSKSSRSRSVTSSGRHRTVSQSTPH